VFRGAIFPTERVEVEELSQVKNHQLDGSDAATGSYEEKFNSEKTV
jgi:hypothetical protein